MIVIVRLRPSKVANCLAATGRFLERTQWNRISGFSLARSVGVAGAVLALCAATTADLAAPVPVSFPSVKLRFDPRAVRLATFFRLYNCPQPLHVSEYLTAADYYQLDYRLLPAISIRETTCGVTEKQNNRWGYHPGRQTFPSVGVGIDYVARQLAQNPTYIGKTLNDKLFTYNPRAAYPVEVMQIMRQIE